MQKFFEKTVQSDFIKSLLYYTPIPILESVQVGDYVLEGQSYIYNSMLIKCTKTGYLDINKIKNSLPKSVGDSDIHRKFQPFMFMNTESHTDKIFVFFVLSDEMQPVEAEEAEYDISQYYNFGDYDQQITPIFNNSASYYDSKTHKALGNYLRAYRGSTGIDLMPFYNCYGFETIDTVELSVKNGIVVSASPLQKEEFSKNIVYSVPIQFNKRYLIHYENMSAFILKSAIYDEEGGFVIDPKTSDFVRIVESNGKSTPMHIGGRRYEDPIEYEVYLQDQGENASFVYSQRNNLRLLIQVPRGRESTLVVTETNSNFTPMYSSQGTSIQINADSSLKGVPSTILNQVMFSQTSLSKMNTGVQYPFSDRLIEYLLLNVIDSADKIVDNTGRVQEALYVKVPENEYGTFSTNLRAALFNRFMENGINRYDSNGFVDKDLEEYLRRKTNYEKG